LEKAKFSLFEGTRRRELLFFPLDIMLNE